VAARRTKRPEIGRRINRVAWLRLARAMQWRRRMHRRETGSPLRRALDDACAALGQVANDWTYERALHRSLARATDALIDAAAKAVALIDTPGSPPGEIADARGAAHRAALGVNDALAIVYEQKWAHPRSVLAASAAIARFVELIVDGGA
jgi:hypothetical protein